MGTHTDRLRELLHDLHEELDSVSDLDAADETELRTALGDLQQTLADSAAERDATSIGTALRKALEGFEGRHPAITGMIGRVAESLSELGI